MKLTRTAHPTPPLPPVVPQLDIFCRAYSLAQAQYLLKGWHRLALQEKHSDVPAATISAFYQCLSRLLPAVYQLHELAAASRLSISGNTPAGAEAQPLSLAATLDTLQASLPCDWVLLISPPE